MTSCLDIIIIVCLLFLTWLAVFWAWVFAIAYHNIEQQFKNLFSCFYFPLPEPPPKKLSINFQIPKKIEHKAIASKKSTTFMPITRLLLGKVCRIPAKIYWSIIGSKIAVIRPDIISDRQPIRTILMLIKKVVKVNMKSHNNNPLGHPKLTEKRIRQIAREETYKIINKLIIARGKLIKNTNTY